MDTRRRLFIALGASALFASLRVYAQQQKIAVIGYLSPVVPQNNTDFRLEAFRQGMREQGYV